MDVPSKKLRPSRGLLRSNDGSHMILIFGSKLDHDDITFVRSKLLAIRKLIGFMEHNDLDCT